MNPFKLMRALHLLAFIATILLLFSCKKESETFQTEDLSAYLPIQTGKYITYRLDSTVFTNFGSLVETHSYEEKHLVDAEITDNLGRVTYRVFRFLRDTAGLTPWRPSGSYFITPTKNTIEVSENNLRIIKLVAPFVQGNSWKGNRFLPDQPYTGLYEFSNDDFMHEWEFTYENINDKFTYKQETLTKVISVIQVDGGTKLDTIDVINNKATVPQNSTSVWLRGAATDTIILNVAAPTFGYEGLTVYNKTSHYASLNKIKIPPGLGFRFEFSNNIWSYPNATNVNNNRVVVPRNASTIYILGNATGNIEVNTSQIDTSNIKKLSVYNRSNFTAYTNFNTQVNTFGIPPNFGRTYELVNGQWRLLDNRNVLIDSDPFINDLPFGSRDYSIEKYAKGIGLIFQELDMWEYQPPSSSRSGFQGFGIKRTIIDHN
jgi:hypothetical protein